MIVSFLIGLLLVIMRLYPSLVFGQVLFFGDNYSLQVPQRIFNAIWLKQGIIPWWNPTIFAGVPWAHDVSQGFFYPTTLLFAIFNPGTALTLSVMIHLLFTYLGMYWLVKKWTNNQLAGSVGAILWTFSPLITGSINNLVILQSIAWFPWVALTSLQIGHRQFSRLLFALTVLGQFLAGYPQHLLYSVGFAVVLQSISVWKTISLGMWFKSWIITGLCTLSLTAVAWVPFIQPLLQSTRVLQTTTQASIGSLHPLQFITSLIPTFFCNPQAGMKWGPAWSTSSLPMIYLTWFGLFGFIGSLKRRKVKDTLLLGFALLMLFFSLGKYLPFYSVVLNYLPFLKFGRYPSMTLIPATLAFILIIGANFKHSLLETHRKLVILLFGLLIISGTTLFLLPNHLPISWHISSFHTFARDQVIFQNLLMSICINTSITLLILMVCHKRWYDLLLLLLGLDMVVNTQTSLFFGPASLYPQWSELTQVQTVNRAQFLSQYRVLTRDTNEPYTDFGAYWEGMTIQPPFSWDGLDQQELRAFSRLKQMRNSFSPDWNMANGVSLIHGYTTLLPQDFSQLWSRSREPRINFINQIQLNDPQLSFWSVGYYLNDLAFSDASVSAKMKLISENPTYQVYSLPALPRIRFENGIDTGIHLISENPNEINLSVDSDSQKKLEIADRYDRGWKAEVNGSKVLIENYQGARRIMIPKGQSVVRIYYQPQAFYLGLGISLLSLIMGLWIKYH